MKFLKDKLRLSVFFTIVILVANLAACSKTESEDGIPSVIEPPPPTPDKVYDEKGSYARYHEHGLEEKTHQLASFDQASLEGWQFASSNGVASAATNKKEGDGAISVRTQITGWTTAVEARPNTFNIDASDKQKSFIRVWVNINDITLLASDKQGEAYEEQGTFYIQVGGHQWNHTVAGSGWHELELSFVNHNVSPSAISSIDYGNLNTFRIRYQGSPGLEVTFDDLRFVTYTSDYVPSPPPYNGRRLSNCDANELGGAVLGEWYGATFNFENKMEGTSSLSVKGSGEHNEYRIYIGGFEEPINEVEDALCFWLYISDLAHTGVQGWTIELNQIQDVQEFQCDLPLINELNGGLENGWNFVTIPINRMRKQVDAAQFGPSITAQNLRVVAPGTSADQEYEIAVDQVFIAKLADLH